MNFRNRDIDPDNTLLDSLKQMDKLDKKLLIVISNGKFIGLLSIGDVQRAIIRNITLDTKIGRILRKDIKILTPTDDLETAKKLMLEFRMELCPVVNSENEVESVYFWEDLFIDKKINPTKKLDLPVVIMAGGFGTRLRPLTNVLPKPLIPLRDKTIIEEIIQHFQEFGCNDFYISVNYKADLIEYYLNNQNLSCNMSFFKEDEPSGTAGSLSLLKHKIHSTFFVSNCDILINQDYSEMLDYHIANKNAITVISALKHYSIPYGTIETGDNGILLSLQEKPEVTFKINTGLYIMEDYILKEIPDKTFIHITELIRNVQLKGMKIGVYPVSEKSWIDIGTWEEYKQALF